MPRSAEYPSSGNHGASAEVSRVLIVGHGEAGRAIAADFVAKGATVVGFLDDHDVSPSVLGKFADVNAVLHANDVNLLCIAIPSIEAARLREFVNLIERDSLRIDILPRTYGTIVRNTVSVEDLTDLDILDLLGRKPVKHDVLASADFLEGKRVLVTGAAGSIGSQLMRQIANTEAAALLGVDWWENGLFFLGREFEQKHQVSFKVADIKNPFRLREIFNDFKPDVVFHAAAYKHVPLMQANPSEAFSNNVLGTHNVLTAAEEVGAAEVVIVSTDKAVNPTNVMGATKRLAELTMTRFAQRRSPTRFRAVRFGNVIESNGSVIQIFRRQLSSKLPLTVTHPDVTRFFMTLDEAAQLILQSTLLGKSGGIFVLDMGEPVRIMDLAQWLVKLVDPSLGIEVIGMRPGEKMYEELSYDPNRVRKTSNPMIFETSDGESEMDTSVLDDMLHLAEKRELGDAATLALLAKLGFSLT